MALLKSGSYVSGDLYVADSIKVNSIKTFSGRNFPYITTPKNAKNIFTNKLAVFSNEISGLCPSPIEITESGQAITIKLLNTPPSSPITNVNVDISNSNFSLNSSTLSLNPKNKEWTFSL